MTIPQAIEAFLIDQQLRGNTPKTIAGYRGFLRRFCDWLTQRSITTLPRLTIQAINEYQLYLDRKQRERHGAGKMAKRSIKTYMQHIKAFLAFCYAEGFIDEPLNQKIKLPKTERPVIEILTNEEVDVLLSCFSRSETGLRNTVIILIMLDCGLRLSEVAGIKTDDINFQKGYITIMGKGRKGRIVPLGLKVRRVCMAYIHKRRGADRPQDDTFFFLTKERKPLTTAAIASLMGRLKEKTGITRLHAHLFRHTFATNFLVHGLGDVYELSRILGHADIRTT
ncbi:MAG: tyrosine-type recombinase/integrase, partial [Defluviitaleaceae bacterium]|nr:tyrosine-type recombinase/integrase [Defluviitaleaceae bacterium]MCL2264365.1 tyrosine-type recombinase/integrase [Defluviitaleaceae bacterium]